MEPKTGQILLPKHIYLDYITQVAADNPALKVIKAPKSGKLAMPYILINGQTIVLTYDRWFNIMASYLEQARKSIIDAERLSMGKLGWIHAKRIERNFRNKKINWKETNKQEKVFDQEKQRMVPVRKIYYTGDDYCRVGWSERKGHAVLYKFIPTYSSRQRVGFKQQFSNANIQNPVLKLKYIYYPFN
jgi:hypothetical protein